MVSLLVFFWGGLYLVSVGGSICVLFWLYLLSRWTFYNKTYYAGVSLWTGVLCRKVKIAALKVMDRVARSGLSFTKPSDFLTMPTLYDKQPPVTANVGTNLQLSCFMSKQLASQKDDVSQWAINSYDQVSLDLLASRVDCPHIPSSFTLNLITYVIKFKKRIQL